MNRRYFYRNTALATLAINFPSIVPSSVFGRNAPSNRINVGMIGLGRQGYGQNLQGANLAGIGARIPGILENAAAQVVAVCDTDSWRLNKAKETVNNHYAQATSSADYRGCTSFTDFRELLAYKDIDAVIISTPDHWHVSMGMLAAKAGKHICCEKPLSMSVQQGRAFADILKKYPVVNRTDSEFRSVRPQNKAVELVRNGKIGTLVKVEISLPSDPEPVAEQPVMVVPKELNYNLWLGPAPFAPYTENRVHSPFDIKKRPGWMRVGTYAQGMIANWGAHYFDVAQWANDSSYSGPVAVEGKGEFPKSLWNTMINFMVTYRYSNGVEMTCQQTPTSKPSIKYIGSEGWILVDGFPGVLSYSHPAIAQLKPASGELDLSGTLWDKTDFINAIKESRATLQPIEVGHRTISISQIGLIACQTGAKLKWNPQKELFAGNNTANALLAAPIPLKEWAV
ncbi:MAG: Gfo/Idh/MocA family oxidoreductase [Chitinophagaceae bacterium]